MPVVPGVYMRRRAFGLLSAYRNLGLNTPRLCAELLAKKRRRDEQWAAERAATAVEAKKKARTNRSSIFKRAEQYVKEYRSQVPEHGRAPLLAAAPTTSRLCVSAAAWMSMPVC